VIDQERIAKVKERLTASLPSDILEAQEILKQKESIVSQAQLEAKRVKDAAEHEARVLVTESQRKHNDLVGDTEILKAATVKGEEVNQEAVQESQKIIQDAQRQAYKMLDETEKAVTIRREGANQYARETLFDLEERLAGQLGQVREGIDALGFNLDTKDGNGSKTTVLASQNGS